MAFGDSFNSAFATTVRAMDAKQRRALEEAMQEFTKNLKAEQLAEEKRQFDEDMGQEDRQFGEMMSFRRDALGQDDRHFDRRMDQDADQFDRTLGFKERSIAEELQERIDAARRAALATYRRDLPDGSQVTYKAPFDSESVRERPKLDPVSQARRMMLEQAMATAQQAEIRKRADVGNFNARDLVGWIPGVANDQQKADSLAAKRAEMEQELAALSGEPPSPDATATEVPTTGPKPGTIIEQDGRRFEFQGGDPADPANWKPTQ